jgi:peptidyl-tRNA hydrolase
MKQVIVIRRDLNMSTGKIVAQTVHAINRTPLSVDHKMYDEGSHSCITCYVKSEAKLLNLYKQVKEAGIPCGLQIDTGHTEVPPNSPTVLNIGPDDEEFIDKITKKLQLWKDETYER